MKKIYRYSAIYALALSFALNTSSCSDFLQVEPTGSLTEEQVFEKIDNVEPLVLGLYKSYRGCKEGRNGLMPYLGTEYFFLLRLSASRTYGIFDRGTSI